MAPLDGRRGFRLIHQGNYVIAYPETTRDCFPWCIYLLRLEHLAPGPYSVEAVVQAANSRYIPISVGTPSYPGYSLLLLRTGLGLHCCISVTSSLAPSLRALVRARGRLL